MTKKTSAEQELGEAIRKVEELLPPTISVIINSGTSSFQIEDWDAEFALGGEDAQRGQIIMNAHDLTQRKL